jgi:hypothetical protein
MPAYQFRVDQRHIINQKADTQHSDNDWLSLAWTVSNTVARTFSYKDLSCRRWVRIVIADG